MPRKKTIPSARKVESRLQIDVYNTAGKVVGKIALPREIFDAKQNPPLLAQAVRVYLANQRLGTHSAKTRGQVTGSTRKIYRQKGTGRARHGDIKAPIFIGGGIAFGPQPRDYSLSLSKQMRKKALFTALSDKFQQGKLKVISGLENIQAKTKEMVEVLLQLQLTGEKQDKQNKILLILPNKLNNVFLAGRNLSYLTTSEVSLLNTYMVLTHKNLLFTKEAITRLIEIFLKKNDTPTTSKKSENRKKKIEVKIKAVKKLTAKTNKVEKKVKTKPNNKKVKK